MFKSTMKLILATCLIVLGAGCHDNTPSCVPATVATGCLCNTGNFGYEVCSSNGLEYGACICGPPPPDASVTNDASVGGDASPASDALGNDGADAPP
jgi:hypothetical protein